MSPSDPSAPDESPAEVVRNYYAAWSRGDLEGMLARADPEILATPTLGVIYDHGAYAGHAGITAWAEEVARKWESFQPAVDGIFERDGKVIAFITLTAGRGGGAYDARFAVVHEFRDGRILRLNGRDLFETLDELLTAENEARDAR